VKIWVIVITEKDKFTRMPKQIVSHGVTEDGRNVVLPNVHPDILGCKFDIESSEYYLE